MRDMKTSKRVPSKEAALPRAIISGFVATLAVVPVLAAAFAVAYAIAESELAGVAIGQWAEALVRSPIVNEISGSLYLALGVHFAAGMVFALIYAYLAQSLLPGPGWLRGALFSLVPWVLSLVLFLPLLGAGFLGLDIGAGPLPAIGDLVFHLVYGAVLGVVYRLMGSAQWSQPNVERNLERSSSLGIVLGAAVGAVIGIVLALLPDSRETGFILGISPWYFAIASALIGAAWGGLIASIIGYSRRPQR